jgi:hypothetical protein
MLCLSLTTLSSSFKKIGIINEIHGIIFPTECVIISMNWDVTDQSEQIHLKLLNCYTKKYEQKQSLHMNFFAIILSCMQFAY